jgi:AmmeMemoRadiSam system protein B
MGTRDDRRSLLAGCIAAGVRLLPGVAVLWALSGTPAAPAAAAPARAVRAQVDTVGFARTPADFAAMLAASQASEAVAVTTRRAELGLSPDQPFPVAVMPHDDYLYAGRVDMHLLPGLQAPRWLLIGVCHACRRLGVRDRLLFDGYAAWRVAGERVPVDAELRAELLAALGPDLAGVDDERQAAEHSLEAMLPWLRSAVPEASFVPVLVPGMSWERLETVAERLAGALAGICRTHDWTPGRDLGILISADAVHYGCTGWGDRGYAPFGCEAAGHAAGRAQDITLAEATLAGPLNLDGLHRFARLVWDPAHPEYPYHITWCGLYSIPCGLAVAARLQELLGLPPLEGYLLRYGDSLTDGLDGLADCGLGVTAPRSLTHWVGYAALGYVPVQRSSSSPGS